MGRGRPRKTNKDKRKQGNVNGSEDDRSSADDAEVEQSTGAREEGQAQDEAAEEDGDNSSSEENNSESSSSEAAAAAPKPKLTEGKIDVDEELDSADDYGSSDSDAELDVLYDGIDTDEAGRSDMPNDLPASFCGPPEKAAETCRLPARRITADEAAIFPFLTEEMNVALRPAYLIARNAACFLWTDDPTLQVTTDRLMGYLVSSSNEQAVLCMHSAGLTTSLPPVVTPEATSSHSVSSASSNSSRENNSAANNNGSNSQLPPNWSPWSTPSARQNLERMAYLAVLFLERYGYINIGAFRHLTAPLSRAVKQPSGAVAAATAVDASATSTTSPRRADKNRSPLKVIVIGAGAAGLIAARQLTYFGAQVTLIEARDRVGGRIWTKKQCDQYADLGAMIITGLSGNPSTIFAKQGGLTLTPIKPGCTLYAANGRPVSHEKDARIEKEFNRILATAGNIAVKDPVNSANKSLGQVIEDLIRFQEQRIIPLKMSHRNLVAILLRRKAKILNEMAEARKEISRAFAEWQAFCVSRESRSTTLPPVSLTTNNTASSNTTATPHQAKRARLALSTTAVGAPSSSCASVSSTNSVDDASENSRPSSPKPESEQEPHSEASKTEEQLTIDVDEEFSRRRQLAQLHSAWKRFDPLHLALTKINRQLEVLSQNPPREVYLTGSERNLVDWHLANLEFANATELERLSLVHWDQDDAYELAGEHCVVADAGGFSRLLAVLTAPRLAPGNSPAPPAAPTAADNCPTNPCGHLQLKAAVHEIAVAPDSGVKVSCVNKAMSEEELVTYSGDVVLCTLPLGVLKESVKLKPHQQPSQQQQHQHLARLTAPLFNPPLPPWKVEAIQRAGFGCLNKLVLFFEDFFWDRSERVFGCIHESTERRGEAFLFWSITDTPCLIALVAGRASVALEEEIAAALGSHEGLLDGEGDDDDDVEETRRRLEEEEGVYLKLPIVERAMATLRRIFSRHNTEPIPNPIGAYATRWRADEFTRGSYSYVAVGSSGDDYDLLAAPLTASGPGAVSPSSCLSPQPPPTATGPEPPPRVYFAGEHTNRHYPASVQGAVFSGLREVARLLNTFSPGETPVRTHGFTLRSHE